MRVYEFLLKNLMVSAIDILLVEDNPNDAELTIRALKKNGLSNRIVHVEDGEEALDFLHIRNKYVEYKETKPKIILWILNYPKLTV